MKFTRREILWLPLAPIGLSLVASCEKNNSVVDLSPTPTPSAPPPTSLPSGIVPRDMWLADAISPFNPTVATGTNGQTWLQEYGSEFITGFGSATYNKLVFLINGQRYEDFGVTTKRILAGQTWSCTVA